MMMVAWGSLIMLGFGIPGCSIRLCLLVVRSMKVLIIGSSSTVTNMV